jgi:hypothetical protein
VRIQTDHLLLLAIEHRQAAIRGHRQRGLRSQVGEAGADVDAWLGWYGCGHPRACLGSHADDQQRAPDEQQDGQHAGAAPQRDVEFAQAIGSQRVCNSTP